MAQRCVHQGCGKTYTDPEEVCSYHPGPPVFHEGLRGWKCCKKPTTMSFDEFMQIPPCTKGKHSTTDVAPKVENRADREQVDNLATKPTDTSSESAPPAAAAAAAAPTRAPLAPQHAPTPPPPPPESDDDDPSLEIPDGTKCRRRACDAAYKKGQSRSDDEKCCHHPGVPIFHEGTQGYSCCKARAFDFNDFLNLKGCKTSPRHLFVGSGKDLKKKAGGEELLETVNHDFYQTSTTVIASFFLKKIDNTKATVKMTPQTLELDLPTKDDPPKRYKASVPLYGTIDTEKSTHRISPFKLELNLCKADGTSWPVLRSDERSNGEIVQTGRAGQI
ncbi:integrin beta-1-binding protein [Xylariomycetidae sp. FL0641]|nr:integrin beta-1-binding protein [Xylariomycetidae sp. FL0641]